MYYVFSGASLSKLCGKQSLVTAQFTMAYFWRRYYNGTSPLSRARIYVYKVITVADLVRSQLRHIHPIKSGSTCHISSACGSCPLLEKTLIILQTTDYLSIPFCTLLTELPWQLRFPLRVAATWSRTHPGCCPRLPLFG